MKGMATSFIDNIKTLPTRFNMEQECQKQLYYKGKMLCRKDNIIYYGNPEDDYLVMMNISGTTEQNGFEIASKVSISLQTNTCAETEKIIRNAERDGLFKALDVAEFWLSDALGE